MRGVRLKRFNVHVRDEVDVGAFRMPDAFARWEFVTVRPRHTRRDKTVVSSD